MTTNQIVLPPIGHQSSTTPPRSIMTTNQIVVPPIRHQLSTTTNASAPFDSPRADVILRSADKVDFRVMKMLLPFASPIFKDMFALSRDSEGKSAGEQEMKDHLPIIQMAESSRTIENLLKLCYPMFISKLPEFNVLEDVMALWEAADKYVIEDVEGYARDALLTPPLIEKEAVRIFAIACRKRWEREARVAARYTLRRPLWEREYVMELEHITAGDLHRLEKYHLECLKNVETIVTHSNISSEWARPLPGCFGCSPTPCLPSRPTPYLPSRPPPRVVALAGWWEEYIQRTKTALAKRTCGETVCTPHFVGEALKHAAQCKNCSETNIVNDLSAFSDRLAAEIERVISTVNLDLQFSSDK